MPVTLVDRNPAPSSPRYTFQWKYALKYAPSILNIGCSDDPLRFMEYAHHFDYDDWTAYHERFTQGDAHLVHTYFPPESFDLVIMGDIHEHLVDPLGASISAAKVAKKVFVMTIFEEWRLSDFGQHIEEGHARAQAENEKLGYKDGEDYQEKHFPLRINGGPMPHLSHINQFKDDDIASLVRHIIDAEPFEILEYLKVPEATYEQHTWSNWLIALKRTSPG